MQSYLAGGTQPRALLDHSEVPRTSREPGSCPRPALLPGALGVCAYSSQSPSSSETAGARTGRCPPVPHTHTPPPTRARSCRTCSGPIPPSPGQTLRAAQRLWLATPQPAAGPGCAPLPGCCREPLAEDYRAHILSLPSSSLGQCSRFSHPPRLPPGPKYGAARLSCCT